MALDAGSDRCCVEAPTSTPIRSSAPTAVARLAAVEPSEHAVGRHRAVGRADSTPTARSARARRSRAARRVDLPAGMVARRRAVLRVRSHRLVESVSRQRASSHRAGASDGGRVRQAAVDVQQSTYAFVDRRTHRGDLHRGRPLEAGADRRRRARRSSRSTCRSSRSSRSAPTRDAVYFIGGSPTEPRRSCACRSPARAAEVLRRRRTRSIDPAPGSRCPKPSRSTAGERDVHAFYYPPTNPDFTRPPASAPPLLVLSHGGPTGAATRRARSADAVLDQPRLRRARRQLRRQHRLRPGVSRSAERAVGHRRRRRLRQRRRGMVAAGQGRSRTG